MSIYNTDDISSVQVFRITIFREPDKWSPEFIDFVSQCLVKIPTERATAEFLLTHEFIGKTLINLLYYKQIIKCTDAGVLIWVMQPESEKKDRGCCVNYTLIHSLKCSKNDIFLLNTDNQGQ